LLLCRYNILYVTRTTSTNFATRSLSSECWLRFVRFLTVKASFSIGFDMRNNDVEAETALGYF
jgi:hypothetical protein